VSEVWQSIASQIPVVVALALLILQLRKSEAEERRARHEDWQEFIKSRDDKWQTFLAGVQVVNSAVHASLVKELEAVGKQMIAVTIQMQVVQVAVERFAAIQECNTSELRYFLKEYPLKDDDKQQSHT